MGKRKKDIKNSRVILKNKFIILMMLLKQIKQGNSVKFDETLDIAINLGVDPKQSDQIVRGLASLPHGTGKKLKVAVFAKDDKLKEAN